MLRHIAVAGFFIGAISPDPLPTLAAEQGEWQRYENSHFIAYSNALPNEALAVLEELEYIRAAAEQTSTFVIPEQTVKTLAILPSTDEEFLRLAPSPTMAGFAQQLDGGSAIVLPVSGSLSINAQVVVRHEFAHTLLFNEWFRYPQWYAEGFAELASNISVNKNSNSFVIGERPKRYGRKLQPVVAWDDLVMNGFDAHRLTDEKQIQLAYAQYWLLFHYLVLNGTNDYASELDRYFAMLTSGNPDEDTFAKAFGFTANQLWEDELKDYGRKIPFVAHTFDPRNLDTEFVQTIALDTDLNPILIYLTDKADARRADATEPISMLMLPGMWDQLKLEGQCTEAMAITVRPDSDVISIEGFYSAPDDRSVPALFAFDSIDKGVFRLTNITDNEYPNVIVTPDFRLTIRNENVFCFDREPVGRTCASIFHRCDQNKALLH